jgi:hypothetical protein
MIAIYSRESYVRASSLEFLPHAIDAKLVETLAGSSSGLEVWFVTTDEARRIYPEAEKQEVAPGTP